MDLPIAPTPILGREVELAYVCDRIVDSSVRLLTVTGPGGTGKTRLAIAAAHALADRYDRGAAFIDLTSLDDPALVLPTIGRALGVRESADRSIAAGLRGLLAGRSLLLVLDNLEHLPGSARDIGALLETIPELDILATSREPLRLRWEHEYALPPLALPLPGSAAGDLADLLSFPSISLLVQRAQAVRPDFTLTAENGSAVAEICRRLDGLPLAIELAAARLKVLSPVALLNRLERRLDVLSVTAPDAPKRHRTLRAAIGWSHDLLAPREQLLFARISVFAGGFTVPAACAVCGDSDIDSENRILDDLSSLVDKSLLIVMDGPGGEPRFRMLETVAEFARERLGEIGEVDVRDAHARCMVAFLEDVEPRVWGREQAVWRARLMAEQDNARAAFHWLLAAGELETVGRILRRTFFPWWTQGQVTEARRWALETISTAEHRGIQLPVPTEALARFAAGFAALEQGSDTEAEAQLTRALELHTITNDIVGIGGSTMALAFLKPTRSDVAGAIKALEKARDLVQSVGDHWTTAFALIGLSAMTQLAGDLELAQTYAEQSLALAREMNDTWSLGQAHDQLAVLAVVRGDRDQAAAWVRQTIPRCLAAGQIEIVAYGLKVMAMAATDPARSARLFGAAEALRDAAGVAIWPSRRVLYDDSQAAVLAQLGEEVFENAWREGRAMSPAEAAEYALADGAYNRQIADGAPSATALTIREREVASLIANGLTSREVSDRLHVSERTIDAHADHIRTKLGLRSRAEIAAWAVRAGLANRQ